MAGRRLDIEEAARLIVHADPLTEVRITIGWDTTNGSKQPLLRLSSRSVVDYKTKAKPLGTVRRDRADSHWEMLHALAGAMYSAGRVREEAE